MFDEADKFINECLSNFRLNIIGLMCLPPMREDPRLHFNRLKKLAADHNLHSLSMGMSGDYHAAIECGATHKNWHKYIWNARLGFNNNCAVNLNFL